MGGRQGTAGGPESRLKIVGFNRIVVLRLTVANPKYDFTGRYAQDRKICFRCANTIKFSRHTLIVFWNEILA